MGGGYGMPPPTMGSGFRRQREEDDINDFDSSPRKRKMVSTIDLTADLIGEERLTNMTQCLNVGSPHRASDTQFKLWTPVTQSRPQPETQRCFRPFSLPFSLKPSQPGPATQRDLFSRPLSTGKSGMPSKFTKTGPFTMPAQTPRTTCSLSNMHTQTSRASSSNMSPQIPRSGLFVLPTEIREVGFSSRSAQLPKIGFFGMPTQSPKTILYNKPFDLARGRPPSTQIPGPRVNWAVGTLPRAAFRADSPPRTPKRVTRPRSSSVPRSIGQTQPLHSLPTRSPYSKSASQARNRPTASLHPARENYRELELDTIIYKGHSLRERKTVELHDGTFLRIAAIKNRIIGDEEQVFLQGSKFQRTREFMGLLALKKNEVAMSSISETIPLSQVIKPRILIMTNATFPKYRDITGDDENDEREGRLVCRWRINMVSKQEGYIWRLQENEVDKEYRTDDSELRETWRGRLVKTVEMLQEGMQPDNLQPPPGELFEQEGFLEWGARRCHFVDLTAEKRTQREEGVKETNHTEIVTNSSSLELKQTSYAPLHHGPSGAGDVGSSSYEATIDSRTPAGRFLGYFQGTYTPNPNPNPPSPTQPFTLPSSLGSAIASPPKTANKEFETSLPRPPVQPVGNFNSLSPNQKQFGIFGGSSFSPFNSPPKKQTYSVFGGPLTYTERTFRSQEFLGGPNANTSIFQSNLYENHLTSRAPVSKILGPFSSQPSTPTKSRTLLELPSISKVDTLFGNQSTPSKVTSGRSPTSDEFLKLPPPPQPVFGPGFSRTTRRKYKFGDAFCGGGGMSSGARAAGLVNTWSFDADLVAATTYRKNFPGCKTYLVYANDFVALPPEDLLVDVVHMSPPCQPHSPAHTIAGKDDDRNEASLFCVKECLEASRPRMVTLEQTDGILNRPEWFRSLIMCFTDLGFSVSWKVLHGVEYGVPQTRKRLFILAASPGEALPNFPAPKYEHPKNKYLFSRLPPPRTVRNAISYIPHGSTCHNPINFPGGPRHSPMDFDQPLRATILASGGPYDVHPSGMRPFTARELACLQTFPTTHDFSGSAFQQKKQIGNAVPPVLAEALLREVRRAMERADRERGKRKAVGGGNEVIEVVVVEKEKEIEVVKEKEKIVIDVLDDEESEVEITAARRKIVVVDV